MTRKRFDYNDETLSTDLSSNAVALPDPDEDIAERLFEKVFGTDYREPDGDRGDVFVVTVKPDSPAEPIIETDTIPDGVSESDIETALSQLKTDGVI